MDARNSIHQCSRRAGCITKGARPVRRAGIRIRRQQCRTALMPDPTCRSTLRWKALSVADHRGYLYTRSLAIEVGQSLKGEDVVRVLNPLKQERGVPKLLCCDNGPEFTGQMMDLWAYRNGVKIGFSRPGKPTDNAFVESFNGTFRAEYLDTNWFQALAEAKQIIEAWRREYNESRPHRALANRTPEEFVSQVAVNRDLAETKTSRFLTL